MKKILLVAPALCLGLDSGIVLVAASNGCSKSAAQTASTGHTVVDSAGNVLGALPGTSPAFASTYNASGTETPVPFYAFSEMHTFLDASNHIWNVGGNGNLFQTVAAVYYTVAGCTGTAYVADGDRRSSSSTQVAIGPARAPHQLSRR